MWHVKDTWSKEMWKKALSLKLSASEPGEEPILEQVSHNASF
jgi:hypothetical protein